MRTKRHRGASCPRPSAARRVGCRIPSKDFLRSVDPSAAPEAAAAPTLLIVLAPFALGYFLSNLFRAVNAVVGPHLVDDLGLGAAALGLLTSAYLFAFALFQLPLGVLLDRFGPRRVQAAFSPAPRRARCCSRAARASRP